ncbi:hypothetical protein HNQ85_002877 [Anoxybacillus calidus]|jgi:hypothetical protein|uniref:Uncharacterized protein n=1 Tax=[Anoxybacillus] calidus TaxID=575178 RepID=A0A7V9Z1W9_9BACL|nr:hypothetical protein [Anoxybacillus calidus]MBA2872566.1 hypothetical protein [Anoxybacillus calidus]
MSSNDLGVIIFLGIMGLISLFLALKYNKSFHSNFAEQNFGVGDQNGDLFILNVLRLLLPYWVYRVILTLTGISLLFGDFILIMKLKS